MDVERIRLKTGYKVALIVLAVFEIVLGFSAFGCSIATIVITKDHYWRCYYDNYYGFNNAIYECGYYWWFFRLSVTAQGIWTGFMVIVAASLNIRFANKPTKQTGSFSAGFSLFSFILTMLMISLESMAVSDISYFDSSINYYANIDALWALHYTLLSLACVFFVLTMTNMIISYLATGCYGCCCYTKNRRTVSPLGVQNIQEHVIAYRQQAAATPGPYTGEQSFIGAREAFGPTVNYPYQQTTIPHVSEQPDLGNRQLSSLTQSFPTAQPAHSHPEQHQHFMTTGPTDSSNLGQSRFTSPGDALPPINENVSYNG